jgi:hypothetical protein
MLAPVRQLTFRIVMRLRNVSRGFRRISAREASVHRFIGCEWVGGIASVYETSVATVA